ncbi:MAG TPA: SGNH/GDSL hydrolase family protein [Burkholderiaceae bacterium]|jgi:phospholipase/lecithinase/hemolysin
MRHYQFALAVLSAAILAGCGGGSASGGDQTTKIKFSAQVSFGDSLSDVGTYDVGTVAALHGGKFTVNTLTPSTQNWTELMAASLGLPAPCPAETGLNGAAAAGFAVTPVKHSGCYGYGQGGARVTNPNGPGSAGLAASLGGSQVLGQLTVPVVTQIQNHLAAVGGKFSGTEVVFVLAGANDVFVQLATLNANATAAGTAAVTASVGAQVQADIGGGKCTPTDAQASNCVAQAQGELWQASLGSAAAVNAAVAAQVGADVKAGKCTPTDAQASNCVQPAEVELVTAFLTAQGTAAGKAYVASTGGPAAVTAMGQAGAELAGYINNLILANGAKYVTVVNIPDIGTTPFGDTLDSGTLGLLNTMVSTFNAQLQSGVGSSANVVLVDANTQSHLNTANPAQYGLTNVTVPACNLASSANPLGSSLVCNSNNVISGDVSHYLFADMVHPSPYGYSLLAKYVATQMSLRGWL